jgi:hypothetical protein
MHSPRLEFYTFGEEFLFHLLGLNEPPFGRDRDERSFRQLNYIERYVGELGCLCVVVEEYYIDRDYIEDFSVFYSRSLYQYSNSCQRLHFFSADKDTVMRRLVDIVQLGRDTGEDRFREACALFSKDHYIGFSVIKPLNGCPVGRTVLRYRDDLERRQR